MPGTSGTADRPDPADGRPPTWRRIREVGRSSVTALCFAGVLAAVAVVPAATQRAWRIRASTNLANLAGHPLSAMVGSAFLTDGDTWAWIALALVGLASAGRVFGNARTALLAVAAHVLATLVSEGILAYRIGSGAAPANARYLIDVGPSYIVVCALVAVIAYGTWPGRLVCAVGFGVLAPYLFDGLSTLEVAAVGHACAVVLGLVLGYPLRRGRAAVTRGIAGFAR